MDPVDRLESVTKSQRLVEQVYLVNASQKAVSVKWEVYFLEN